MNKLLWTVLGAIVWAGAAVGGVTVRVEAEKPVLPAGKTQDAMVRIMISADPLPAAEKRARVNLAVALDRSGSMRGGGKLENAKAGAIAAVNMLGDGDIFSLVAYDDLARVVIPATRIDGGSRDRIIRTIEGITTGGSTALYAGVALAAEELGKCDDPEYVSRLILLSDGLANVGPASPEELGRFGAGLIRRGVSVSTMGVGNDYNEDLMTALAQNSDGNFYFVENSRDLSLIFEKELESALAVAVKTVTLRIECPEGVRPKGILGHSCRVDGSQVEINFNQIYAGHDKVLILQLEVPPGVPDTTITAAVVKLDFEDAVTGRRSDAAVALNLGFTQDAAAAASMVNKEVKADVVLQQSVSMREEAIREADSGKFTEAADRLRQAADLLTLNAEATGDRRLEARSAEFRRNSEELAEAPAAAVYSSARKEMVGMDFQYSNSQTYQQESVER